ncbi:MAG: dehydrogenase [Proteobacteria bacterium]|nr:dehydrogenase [Pseudomonadota bacterium]MBI3498814.1 dehydrogenase [Pseudomonadota bacterium]
MPGFRLAISGDYKTEQGELYFKELDLRPLDAIAGLSYGFLPRTPVIDAKDLAGHDAVMLLGHRMARSSFPGDDRLTLIARFGVGYDNVDVDACNEHAVALLITPDGVRRPVAVAVITMMLALTTKLMVKDRITREGPAGWARKTAYNGVGLVGRTLGSLGIGNIGAEVFRMAKPFEMRYIAFDPYADKTVASALGIRLVDLETLFRESDILSVSCPLTPETRHLVNAERLALMKPTAYLINTARGPVCEQKALTRALAEGRIAGAGLDVLDPEPPSADDPILKLDSVVFAPHALCWTDQFINTTAAVNYRAIREVMAGQVPGVGKLVNPGIVDNPSWKQKLAAYARIAKR